LQAAGKTSQRIEPELLLVTDATSPEIGELSARENIVLHELVGEALSLEDVFLQMTASAELAPSGPETP
jgi:ABC-2 type transport system ATP-binding protein